MSIITNLFGKKYLEWDEYVEKIHTIDEIGFKKKVLEQNEKVKKEMLKNMNFSG